MKSSRAIRVQYGNSYHYEFSNYYHGKNSTENGLDQMHGLINIHVELFCPAIIPFIADSLLIEKTEEIRITFSEKAKDFLKFEVDKAFSYRAHVNIESDFITISKSMLVPSQQGITFGIVSGGNNDSKIKALIESIILNYKTDFEIIIAGPLCTLLTSKHVRYVNTACHEEENRIPICHKKNLIVESANYETVILMHDRYILPDGFNMQFSQDIFFWDVLCFRQKSMDLNGYRLQDWQEIDAVDVSQFASNKDIGQLHPFSLIRSGARLINYSEYPKTLTINGGFFAVKKSWFKNVKLAEYLYWAEIEDDDFSLRAQDAGAVIRLSHATVISMDERSSGLKSISAFSRIKIKLQSLVRLKCHSIINRITEQVSGKLNPELGFTKKKVIYTKEKTLILDARKTYDAVNTEGFDTIYLFGMERIGDVRSILDKIKNAARKNQKIVFEYCTFGAGFFSRLRTIRNCELLCYEISLVFKDIIILERMINTSQNNYLLEYKCIKTVEAISGDNNVLVLTSPLSNLPIEKKTIQNVTALDYLNVSRGTIKNYKAIFLAFDDLSAAIKLPPTLSHTGVQKFSSEKTPLIKSNLLVSADVFLDCMPVNSVNNVETFKAIFVHNIAIKGYGVTLASH